MQFNSESSAFLYYDALGNILCLSRNPIDTEHSHLVISGDRANDIRRKLKDWKVDDGDLFPIHTNRMMFQVPTKSKYRPMVHFQYQDGYLKWKCNVKFAVTRKDDPNIVLYSHVDGGLNSPLHLPDLPEEFSIFVCEYTERIGRFLLTIHKNVKNGGLEQGK